MKPCYDLFTKAGRLVREKSSGRIFTYICISGKRVMMSYNRTMILTPLKKFEQAMEFLK